MDRVRKLRAEWWNAKQGHPSQVNYDAITEVEDYDETVIEDSEDEKDDEEADPK